MSRPRVTSNNAPKPQSQQEYPLHRLVLSRSPYFSVLMRGPWKDATSPTLTLEIQDPLVDEAAVEVALGFLYEKVPEELTPELATKTLAMNCFKSMSVFATNWLVSLVSLPRIMTTKILCKKAELACFMPSKPMTKVMALRS